MFISIKHKSKGKLYKKTLHYITPTVFLLYRDLILHPLIKNQILDNNTLGPPPPKKKIIYKQLNSLSPSNNWKDICKWLPLTINYCMASKDQYQWSSYTRWSKPWVIFTLIFMYLSNNYDSYSAGIYISWVLYDSHNDMLW